MKGFLKYKVLMKSRLVGGQYRLTRLLKTAAGSTAAPAAALREAWEEQELSSGVGAEQCEIRRGGRAGHWRPMQVHRYLPKLQRVKKQLGLKPAPPLVAVPRNLGPVQLCHHQPLEQQENRSDLTLWVRGRGGAVRRALAAEPGSRGLPGTWQDTGHTGQR